MRCMTEGFVGDSEWLSNIVGFCRIGGDTEADRDVGNATGFWGAVSVDKMENKLQKCL